VAKAERIHGVMGAYWNPRTHEMTIRYDAIITSGFLFSSHVAIMMAGKGVMTALSLKFLYGSGDSLREGGRW